MRKPLIKIIGILLVIVSFVFISWVFLNGIFKYRPEISTMRFSFGQSLVLNILGVLGLGFGLKLAGSKLFTKREEPYATNEKPTKKIQAPEKTQLKDFGKDDHDRFMPK